MTEAEAGTAAPFTSTALVAVIVPEPAVPSEQPVPQTIAAEVLVPETIPLKALPPPPPAWQVPLVAKNNDADETLQPVPETVKLSSAIGLIDHVVAVVSIVIAPLVVMSQKEPA